VRHANWPAAGLVLDTDPNDSDPAFESLARSDTSHWIAGWSRSANDPVHRQIVLQRFALDGTLDAAWPANGVVAAGPDSLYGGTFIADGLGGVIVLWYAHGLARGTHVRADGTFVPGLSSAGVVLTPAGASFVPPGYFANQALDYVIADRTPAGGLVFAWDDGSIPHAKRVRWLLPDLSPDPAEDANGRLIIPAGNGSVVRGVHADGAGGAYVAWETIKPPPSPQPVGEYDAGEVWMTRLLPSSLAGVSPKTATFALSAPRPNPARGAVTFDLTLPDDSPARVELLDVAGRVLRTQRVRGPGAHPVSFGALESCAPGLYFARATTAAGARTQRVVLTH